MANQLKKWQGWVLFGASMVVVFLLGLLVSSLMERRAEVASVFNNKRSVFNDSIIAQLTQEQMRTKQLLEEHRTKREVQGRLPARV